MCMRRGEIMDKNIFNNLLTKVDSLQTRLKAYNSFKSELESMAEVIKTMITEEE